MIKIVAVIRPHKLAEVQKALVGLGIYGLTVTEVKGHGHQGGHTEQYRGTSRVVDLVPKLRVETVVESARADEATTTLLKTWAPHVRDWRDGDPTWQGGKGKGIIYVKGNVNIYAGSNSVFLGLLYVHGQLNIHGPALVKGAIVGQKGINLNGSGGPVVVQHSNKTLEALELSFANYRVARAIRPLHGAEH